MLYSVVEERLKAYISICVGVVHVPPCQMAQKSQVQPDLLVAYCLLL